MHTGVLRRTTLSSLCAVALVSGCSNGDKKADTAMMADSAAMAAKAAPAPAMAPAMAPMTDANILAKLDAANMSDSAGGALASQKGTDASVREFGKMMMTDHHKLRKEGQDLAKKLNITPAMPAGDNQEAMEKAAMDSAMNTAKGADWDKWYINNAVAGHEKVLAMAQEAANTTQNADIKAAIGMATPVVQKHLDRAKAIQSKMGGAMMPAGKDTGMMKKP